MINYYVNNIKFIKAKPRGNLQQRHYDLKKWNHFSHKINSMASYIYIYIQ